MTEKQESSQTSSASKTYNPAAIEPDVDFIRTLTRLGGTDFKHCMQCGTCSVTCSLSPDRVPFPRKEMTWSAWGLKDRLMGDPDLWLCHQCNDCSTSCPRGARPGDLMAVVRQEVIAEYSMPHFLGRWVNNPKFVLPLLVIPAVLLGVALLVKNQIGSALGFSAELGDKVSFPYSPGLFPHWLLNSFFFFFSALVLIAAVTGIIRFWRKLRAAGTDEGFSPVGKSIFQSTIAAVRKIFVHDNFTLCSTPSPRFLPHFGVFFGFIALSFVTLWAITSSINPLMQEEFVYPFNFWNPLKILANLGGLAIILGCIFMIYDRIYGEHAGNSTYSDWAFLSALVAVVGTGFITELLHYARLAPHRHVAYFIHLVFVFALIMYLPYSKFAHLIYRTVALAYLEFTGRTPAEPASIRVRSQMASAQSKFGKKQELQTNKGTM